MSLIRILPPLLSVLVLTGCTIIKVRSDFDPKADFSEYETFAWLEQDPPAEASTDPMISELVLDRIHVAVDRGMAAQWMQMVPAEEAQLLVAYHISIEQRVQITDPYYAYDTAKTYDEGTLVIDFIDAKTNKLVWRGVGQTRLRSYKTPEQRQQRVDEVVDKIFEQYPPHQAD